MRFARRLDAASLLEGVACAALLVDKGDDADALIETLRDRRIAVVIPPRSDRKDKRQCDFILDKERNSIERLLRKTQAISCDSAEGGLDRITSGILGQSGLGALEHAQVDAYSRWLHSLRNEPDYPLQVWALARK